jgi:hypothetical protein
MFQYLSQLKKPELKRLSTLLINLRVNSMFQNW